MTDMDGWVAFVGAGPGDDGLMTLRGARLLGAASLVVAEAEVADRVRHLLAAEARGGRAGVTPRRRPACWCRRRRPGSSPSGCSPATRCCPARPPRCRRAPAALVRFEIVPGVPAATGVPAYAGIALPADSAGELRVVHANEVSQVGYAPGHPGGPGRGDRARRPRQDADRGRLARRHAVRDHLGRDDHRPADGRHHAWPDRARPEGGGRDRRHYPRRRGRGGRRGGRREEQAVLVRDQAAVRLAGARAADQGAGVGRLRAAARVRRRARGGADHRGRAAAHPAADGARRQGPGHRPVPVGGVHLDQRGQGGAGEARGVRP